MDNQGRGASTSATDSAARQVCGQCKHGRAARPTVRAMASRFLTLDDLADELTVSRSQAYALVRDGTVPAMQVGGRRQWRVERTRLEQWIQDSHADTAGSVTEQSATRPRPDQPAQG